MYDFMVSEVTRMLTATVVAREGFEPPFPDPYSGILPLNDRAILIKRQSAKGKGQKISFAGLLLIAPCLLIQRGQLESNQHRTAFQTAALPLELHPLIWLFGS